MTQPIIGGASIVAVPDLVELPELGGVVRAARSALDIEEGARTRIEAEELHVIGMFELRRDESRG